MRIPRAKAELHATTRTVFDKWQDLVHWPDDEGQTRRKLQLWAWKFNAKSYVLLKPKQGTRIAVVAETLDGTATDVSRNVRAKEPDQFGDDVVTTRVRIHWYQPDTHCIMMETVQAMPNALALRYVTEAALLPEYLELPLPDNTWDYTCEHPDHPGVRQPGPPCLVHQITNPVSAAMPKKAPALDFDDL